MKRLALVAACAALCATGVPADAAQKPVPMKFFLHGTTALGEAEGPPGANFMTMDTTAPSGSQSKSKQVTNYVGGPNTECAGNSLFPVWIGQLSGDVSGPATIALSAFGSGGSVEIRLFADVEAQACNDEFPKVAGSVTVPVPAGQGKIEAVIKNVKLKAKSSFMLQVSPVALSGDQARVFYDSGTDPSGISFSCVPRPGKKAC